MSKRVFILGGSYAVDEDNPISWVTRLHKKYKVTNLAKANSSNSDMLLSLLSIHEKLTNDDIVIVVWNEYMFPYLGNIRDLSIDKKEQLMSDYFNYFYNEQLAFDYYLYVLNRFKELTATSKLIVLWSSPSNQSSSFTWPWKQDFHLNWKKHTFAINFENEIRPGLVYFSKKELKDMNLKDEALRQILVDDPRPNHIGSELVHENIFLSISKFIDNKASGIINLDIS